MTNPTSLEWAGGECPVAGDTLVDIRLRDGDVWSRNKADEWTWQHSPDMEPDLDIIAYRVIGDDA